MWNVHDRRGQLAASDRHSLTACWNADGHDWVCLASGGTEGITFGDPDGLLHLSVLAPHGEILPVAEEQHVRGDEWKITLPENCGQFSLRLSIRVVEATPTRLIVEPTFSIQTSLLDTHPTLDLRVSGNIRSTHTAAAGQASADSISSVDLPEAAGQIHVLLGPLDAPFTQDLSTPDSLRLRLFGEFLEKGVIRKARPWIVLDRSSEGVSAESLDDYLHRLTQVPLPLTA